MWWPLIECQYMSMDTAHFKCIQATSHTWHIVFFLLSKYNVKPFVPYYQIKLKSRQHIFINMYVGNKSYLVYN